jgi:ribose/xylose/arabinose/galactoside ABC-type transport system permease subunit
MTLSKAERFKNYNMSGWVSYILRYGVYFVFFLMIMVFSFSNIRFLSVPNLFLILQQAAPLGLAVIGVTFVLIVAGVDLSIGQNMFMTATFIGIAIEFLTPFGLFNSAWGYIIVFLISIVSGLLVGTINGFVISKFKIVAFITTLAVMSIIRGVALISSNSKVYSVENLGVIANGNVKGIPYVIIIFIVLLLVFDYLLRKTPFGRQIMAIGNDAAAAQKSGINVQRNTMLVYIICGVLTALGGALSAGQVGSVAVYFANGNEFTAMAAAVLGGTSLFGGKGSIIPGAIIGIILITTIMNGMAMMNASPYAYMIVRGAIIFLAVMVDSISYKGELR